MSRIILDVKELAVSFFTEDGEFRAVDEMSYTVHEGECVAIIGESGSGKTVSALSILRLVPFPPGLIVGGKIFFGGETDLLQIPDEDIRKIRGARIGYIFQEPMTALDPVMTVGRQMSETLTLHRGMNKKDAMREAVELLRRMDIPAPEQRINEYPHQLSGGMQQRVMIAMAMSCNPDILIADEPTTALDVSVQAQVLEQLNHLRRQSNTALILITHNLGVVARYADSVHIVYGGRIVESGATDDIFEDPRHPYTIELIRAVPRIDRPCVPGRLSGDAVGVEWNGRNGVGCSFAHRCARADIRCKEKKPPRKNIQGRSDSHFCACFYSHPAVEGALI
jgi:oligopeptide/dipeptide ABC transporter ATP-binding protein